MSQIESQIRETILDRLMQMSFLTELFTKVEQLTFEPHIGTDIPAE